MMWPSCTWSPGYPACGSPKQLIKSVVMVSETPCRRMLDESFFFSLNASIFSWLSTFGVPGTASWPCIGGSPSSTGVVGVPVTASEKKQCFFLKKHCFFLNSEHWYFHVSIDDLPHFFRTQNETHAWSPCEIRVLGSIRELRKRILVYVSRRIHISRCTHAWLIKAEPENSSLISLSCCEGLVVGEPI